MPPPPPSPSGGSARGGGHRRPPAPRRSPGRSPGSRPSPAPPAPRGRRGNARPSQEPPARRHGAAASCQSASVRPAKVPFQAGRVRIHSCRTCRLSAVASRNSTPIRYMKTCSPAPRPPAATPGWPSPRATPPSRSSLVLLLRDDALLARLDLLPALRAEVVPLLRLAGVHAPATTALAGVGDDLFRLHPSLPGVGSTHGAGPTSA